jgi:hypothetical protein
MGGEQDDTLTADLEQAWQETENASPEQTGRGDDAGDVDQVEQVEPSPISAPEHWSAQDRAQFDALPDELKPLWLEKTKLIERGYTAKFEELANDRRSYAELRDLFGQDQMQQIQAAGLTPAAYMKRLVSTFAALQANPQATLAHLAQQYGVQQGGDPRVASLEQAVQNIHASEWQSFIRATDQSGAPLYPGAAYLQRRVGAELQMNPERPGESTRDALVRAYEAAKWSHPELRENLLAQREKAAVAEMRRKDDLAKARRASPAPRAKTFPGADMRAPKASLRDELSEVWDQVHG